LPPELDFDVSLAFRNSPFLESPSKSHSFAHLADVSHFGVFVEIRQLCLIFFHPHGQMVFIAVLIVWLPFRPDRLLPQQSVDCAIAVVRLAPNVSARRPEKARLRQFCWRNFLQY